MRVLITGGSGFIGSNLISYLKLLKRFEIINIDVLSPLEVDQVEYWKNVNILSKNDLLQAIRDFSPEYVIHLAARTDIKEKISNDYSVNVIGTQNIIDICINEHSIKKVLFISSMLVCKVGHIPKRTDEYSADTLYGESKIKMEELIRSKKLPWQWVILRLTSIWGPGFKEPYRNFFDMVNKGKFLDVENVYCTKTYGYIENTVYQILRILESNSTNEKVYYLGDDPPIFISKWAREVSQELGKHSPIKVPFFVIKTFAVIGDIMSLIGIKFPMTSFRLKNMTTDNIINLEELNNIAPNPPCTRIDGIRKTIKWLNYKERI